MTMQLRFSHLVCWAILLSVFNAATAYSDQTLISYQTREEPVIDGQALEKTWRTIKPLTTFDKIAGTEMQIKSAYNEKNIFFLIRYPDKDESRSHRSWTWNNETQMYDEGTDREDIAVFKWGIEPDVKNLRLDSDDVYKADVWFWKACRTDPMGYADDKIQQLFDYREKDAMQLSSKSGKEMYLTRKGDEGTATYKTTILVEHQKDKMPRYQMRQPEGSRADVRAKGKWKDGQWTIEIARALVTGNSDDVNFYSTAQSYNFGISRFEIAGRPPEPEAEVPLFGSGEITEMLTLQFQQ